MLLDMSFANYLETTSSVCSRRREINSMYKIAAAAQSRLGKYDETIKSPPRRGINTLYSPTAGEKDSDRFPYVCCVCS
jgi:hypothetical protein